MYLDGYENKTVFVQVPSPSHTGENLKVGTSRWNVSWDNWDWVSEGWLGGIRANIRWA
jgi:hypothetical protein